MPASLLLTLALALPVAKDDADDQYNFIVGLAEKGLSEMVVKEATTFLDDHGSHAKADLARYRLATALFDLGRADQARGHLASLYAKRDFQYAAEVAFRLGQCELQRGANAEASEAFQRVLDGSEDYLRTPATFLAGEASFRRGEYAAAAKLYRDTLAAEDAGDYARDAAHGLCWCAFRLRDFEGCIVRVDEYLARHGRGGAAREGDADGRRSELRFLRAESLLEAGRPQEALGAYESVRSGAFRDGAVRGSGFAAAALGRHAQAAAYFERLLAEFPQSRYRAEAALHRGIHLLKSRDAEGALEALRTPEAGDGAETHYWRGRCQARLERPAEALKSYDAALSKGPEDELEARVHVARGDALFDLGRSAEAARAYERAGSDYAVHAAAVARLNDGQPEEAVRLARPLTDPERKSPYRVEAQLTVAEGLFAQGEYADAERAFRAVAREDDDPARKARATARMAWCRYLAGDMKAAAQGFRAVVQGWPDAPEAEEARFMEGRAHEARGVAAAASTAFLAYLERHAEGEHRVEAMLRMARFEDGEQGERRLAALLEVAGDSEFAPQAHHDLAERLSSSGRFEEALPHFAAVVKGDPRGELAPTARYGLAWCQYSTGDFAGAARQLEALVALVGGESPASDPDLHAAALELQVWSLRKRGDAEGARNAFVAFARVCNDERRCFAAARVAAAGLEEAGRLSEAQALYADLLKHTTDRAVAVGVCVERAHLYLDQDRPDEAEAQARAAYRYVQDDAELAEVFFFLGEARFEQGDDEGACELYDIAARAGTPAVVERALYKGGFARLRRGEHEAAARDFKKLVEEHPDSELFGESLFLLGETSYRAGRYDEAARWLARMRDEVPRHQAMPKALFRLGIAQARTEAWRDAAQTLSDLAKRFPDFDNLTEAELWRGRAFAALDQRRGARQAFQRVIGSDRGVLAARARIALGRLSLEAGERDDALSEFLKVALLYAHDEEVAEALYMAGQVLEAQGDADNALMQYRELLTKHADASFAGRARARVRALEK